MFRSVFSALQRVLLDVQVRGDAVDGFCHRCCYCMLLSLLMLQLMLFWFSLLGLQLMKLAHYTSFFPKDMCHHGENFDVGYQHVSKFKTVIELYTIVMFPLDFSTLPLLFLSLPLSVSLCLCFSLCLYRSLSLSVSLLLPVSVSQCISLPLYLPLLYLCLSSLSYSISLLSDISYYLLIS